MKKLTVLITAVVFSITVMAQEKTFFHGELHNGGYGAFFTKIGAINGSSGTFMGGQASWILNHKLALGGKGYRYHQQTVWVLAGICSQTLLRG